MAQMLSKRFKNVQNYDYLQLNGSVISLKHQTPLFGMNVSKQADEI